MNTTQFEQNHPHPTATSPKKTLENFQKLLALTSMDTSGCSLTSTYAIASALHAPGRVLPAALVAFTASARLSSAVGKLLVVCLRSVQPTFRDCSQKADVQQTLLCRAVDHHYWARLGG